MGDPKRFRKQYDTPMHPWNAQAIEQERAILREYGLRNKQEYYRAVSYLKKYKNIAKRLIAQKTPQGEKEKAQMMGKLIGLGLLAAGAELDDLLSLEPKNLLERRLQTVLQRKGLARTTRQARQFIIHRHVFVGDKPMTAPSYLVSLADEAQLQFRATSPLADIEHPERINEQKAIAEEVAKIRVSEEDSKAQSKDLRQKKAKNMDDPKTTSKSVTMEDADAKTSTK